LRAEFSWKISRQASAHQNFSHQTPDAFVIQTSGAKTQSCWRFDVAAEQAAEKVPLIVIPNQVRNLSGFDSKEKEGFLGTQRASE
jgi:hypothetical protein